MRAAARTLSRLRPVGRAVADRYLHTAKKEGPAALSHSPAENRRRIGHQVGDFIVRRVARANIRDHVTSVMNIGRLLGHAPHLRAAIVADWNAELEKQAGRIGSADRVTVGVGFKLLDIDLAAGVIRAKAEKDMAAGPKF